MHHGVQQKTYPLRDGETAYPTATLVNLAVALRPSITVALQGPLRIGQVTRVAQLVPVVAGRFSVVHIGAPREAAPQIGSQAIRAAQPRPVTNSNDSRTFRTVVAGE